MPGHGSHIDNSGISSLPQQREKRLRQIDRATKVDINRRLALLRERSWVCALEREAGIVDQTVQLAILLLYSLAKLLMTRRISHGEGQILDLGGGRDLAFALGLDISNRLLTPRRISTTKQYRAKEPRGGQMECWRKVVQASKDLL